MASCTDEQVARDPAPAIIDAEPPCLFGASGKNHAADDAPWAMPEPTTVSKATDGHPSGRHMIDSYRMMGAAARVSGGKHQSKMAEVYELAALCIENEARRADRAEALLRQEDRSADDGGDGVPVRTLSATADPKNP